jgi:hypothetical protein
MRAFASRAQGEEQETFGDVEKQLVDTVNFTDALAKAIPRA